MAGNQESEAAHRDVKSVIIEAAETVFAANGFEGSTTRTIADEAGVNLALIHYHFSSKEKLYEVVIVRRVKELNDIRRATLAEAMRSEPVSLEGVLDAFIRPPIEYATRIGPRGVNHARIVTQIIFGATAIAARLRMEIFASTAEDFIHAFEKALPRIDRLTAAWLYYYAGTVLLTEMTVAKQVNALSGGHRDADANATIARVTAFVTAGARALDKLGSPQV